VKRKLFTIVQVVVLVVASVFQGNFAASPEPRSPAPSKRITTVVSIDIQRLRRV
jgi:hypothetical protein